MTWWSISCSIGDRKRARVPNFFRTNITLDICSAVLNATSICLITYNYMEVTTRAKLINDAAEKTYAIIMEAGEEVVTQLQRFAKENNLAASRFTAIGAFSSATLGYFNWDQKHYEKIPVNEQVEVLSLIGDVALQDGESSIHVH